MKSSTSQNDAKKEDVYEPIPDCEWHTKDPLTGEIFFLSKGILYSKLPSKEKQKIISINSPENIPNSQNKNEIKKKDSDNFLCNSAKFSNTYKGNKIQIFGGQSIANNTSSNDSIPSDNYVIVTNILHIGIVELEFICPISCFNLLFGMISQKDLDSNNIQVKQFKNFKTSSRRNVIMKINYWNKECTFYLNNTKVNSYNFQENDIIPIVVIKKRTSCVILNPLVKYYLSPIKSNFFEKEILFKLKDKIKINNTEELNQYILKSFNKQLNLKYAFGDVNKEGEINNFICAKFDKKSTNEIQKNFRNICTNSNISLPNNKTIKEIKKDLTNSYDLSYLNVQAYLNKLNLKYTPNNDNKDADSNLDPEYKNVVLKYLLQNFEEMKIYKNQSIKDLKNKFLEYKNNTKEDMFDYMKQYSENENNNSYEDSNNQECIDYIKKGDCLLLIKKNKLKIIQRENNGLFDLTNFIELKESNINGANYIVYEKDDLKYLLQNLDVQAYFSYYPSFKKVKVLSDFLNSIEKGEKIGNNKILIYQLNTKFFYNSLISFLNFVSFVTKRNKVLNQNKASDSDTSKEKIENVKSLNSLEKESNEKENLNIMSVFPFGCFGDEYEDNDDQSLNSSMENSINYEDYVEFVIKDPLIHAKLLKIINKILVQLSTKNENLKLFGNNNMFNSYENLASFVNYPFCNNIPITALSDNGFYCENAFTNELKIYDTNHKLVDTDMLNSNENIDLYLKENVPSYLPNSSLKDLSPIINSSYRVNNMNFVIENNDKIELYHINEKVPILATCSKQGLVNIYSYALGLKKLGTVNILKGIKKPQNFSEIGDISKLKSLNQVKNFEDFLNNKKSINDTYGKKLVDGKNNFYNYNSNNYYFKPKVSEVVVDEESLKTLITMGFKREVCIKALKEKKNNFEDAIDYILSNPGLFDTLGSKSDSTSTQAMPGAKNFIGKWNCPQCTYENNGLEKCEMCESKIPDDIYEKFLNNYTKGISNEKKQEPKKIEKKEEKVENKDMNLMEDNDVIYKDVLIKNIHICYDPYGSDPYAPFVLVAILFNYVENKMIVNTYKLMINPLCINSFIQFNNGKYSENITNRREHDIKILMNILNQKHFYNVNILYPIFIGENKNNSNENNYMHLIPIDHQTHEIKIQSFFDSCAYNYNYYDKNHKIKSLSLFALNEEPEKFFTITEYLIQCPLYVFDTNKKSNIIIVTKLFNLDKNILRNSIQKICNGEFITELKIFQDEKLLYILSKGGYISISKENQNIIEEKMFNNSHEIDLLKRVVPIYDKTFKEIIEFMIYDENQSITINIKGEDKNMKKEEEIIDDMNKKEEFNLEQINIKSLNINEINNLSNLLDTQKVEIVLPNKGGSINTNNNDNEVKGLVNVRDNYYNKIYFDVNKKGKIIKKIKLKKSLFVPSSDIDIVFNLKYNLLEKGPIVSNNKSINKIEYSELTSKKITKEDLYNYKNLIPLTIYDYKGSQSQYSINVSNLVTGAHRFVSNYPKPEFLFSHINNEIMIVDNIIISSDVLPKSVDMPFGEGLIFLMNSLDSIDKAREKYSSFNYTEFETFINDKKANNEDLYEYDPVCYIKMENNEMINTTLIKSRKCKYIYLLPLNGRDGNLKNFETQLMSLLFFGVQGKVNINNLERIYEDKSNYIFAKFGNKSIIDNLKIEIYGYKSNDINNRILIGSKDKFTINDVLLNKDIDSEFYVSKNMINNYQKNIIDYIDIEISNNLNDNDLFEMISVSASFTTFKSMEIKKQPENIVLSTEKKDDSVYDKIISDFYKLILNQELFEKFILMFIPYLVDDTYDREKKISIIRYLNSLFQKKGDIKSKILSKIDYYKFITQNILNDNNQTLSNISITFILDSYQSKDITKIIEDTFYKILNNFKDIEMTNNGFNNFIKLLSIITTDQNLFKEKALSLINTCLKNIEENKYQTNELTYLNTFLFLNNYPSDNIIFNTPLLEDSNSNENENIFKKNENVNNSNTSNIPKQASIKVLNGINYKGNIQLHKEFFNVLLCMKETNLIEEINIYFDDTKQVIPSQGYNFRLQIYSIVGEKDYDLKSSKYYYDHNWKLLTKTYGKTKSNLKNKDLKERYYNDEETQAEDCLKKDPIKELSFLENQSNVIKINFKKWNNEFCARYLYFELSIYDGTKELNQMPNIIIFPVIIGHESSTKVPSQDQFEKFFNYYSPNKKTIYNKIQEISYYEPNNDKKRIIIEYNDEKNKKVKYDEKKAKSINDTELLSLYSQVKSKNKEIKKKIDILVDKKKTKGEKEKTKTDIIEINKNIELLQNQINEYNPKTSLNKSHSFNVQLLKVLIIELNNKKDLDLGDIYNIIIQLIDIILFNQVSYKGLYDQIFKFIDNYFFKKASKDQKDKLFKNLINKYLNNENIYRNVRTIILNKIWSMFDITLFVAELKKCFDPNNKELWENKNFSKIFYKTSILIMIIMKKLVIKEERDLLSLKEMPENYSLFINQIILNKDKLKSEYSNLILNRILSLYSDHLLLVDKYERIKSSEPEKTIDFLIELLYVNNDQQIKDKIENIIQLLLDPYKKEDKKQNINALNIKSNVILPVNVILEEPNKNKEEKGEKKTDLTCYGDKIIVMIQKKILKFINIISQNKFIENDDNKLEYSLSLLNTSYTLKQSEDIESKTLIKKQNNQIIEGFIKISSLFKDNKKLGFSNINNFWKYLTNLLEKGTIEMLFYNNNFLTLVIDCYLNLDKELQILLYTKLTKLFMSLYTKNEYKLNEDISSQILKIIIHLMKNNLNSENEEHLLDFMNNLLEILLYGNYSNSHIKSELKISTANFININNNENNLLLIKELFILSGKFLLLKLNYSSFGESECGNKLIYKRSCFIENILLILDMYVKILYAEIKEEDISKEDFHKSLRNYLIFLIFNNVKEKGNLPPVLANLVKIREYVNKIINCCTEKRSLIKGCLDNLMVIMRNVDEITFDKIKKGNISFKKGLKIITKLFNVLCVLLNVLLVNDDITKYFAFELDGFKFFIDRINFHNIQNKGEKNTEKIKKVNKKKNLNLIGGVNEMENDSDEEEEEKNDVTEDNAGEINEELLKIVETNETGLNLNKLLDQKQQDFLNKFIFIKNKQQQQSTFSDKNNNILNLINNNNNVNLITSNNPFLPPFTSSSYIEEKMHKLLKIDEHDSHTFNDDLSSYKCEEFATTKRLTIFDSNGDLIPGNTYNWYIKKKPTNGYILTREMKDKRYYEENIDYQLNYPIDLKEVLITFSQNTKITEEFPEVYLECGLGLNKLDICVKLERLKDEQYNERSVIAYGFNFYSNKPELINDDDNYIENYLNQIIKCHAQYFRFIVRRPIILANKNTYAKDINNTKVVIGINCVSLIGVKFVNQIKVLDYIGEKEKNVSIKIISNIFTNEFTETLRYIAKDKSIFENIKQIYNVFEPNINKYVSILSKILINASKYNYELGEWLLHRLLNVDHGQIYAKFAVEIMKNNSEYVDKRINKYCSFLLKEIKNCNEKNKLENIGHFIEYFCLTLNGLLLSPFIKVIKINIDLDEIRNIMFNLHKYKQIKKELINLITIILLPHDKIVLNENEIDASKYYHPNNSLKTLTDLYNNSYSYDYIQLLSFLVSNNLRFEKVFVENEAAKYFCDLILDEINSGIRGRNMLFMTEMLKNMSYNSNFTEFIRKNDYDFKLFESIKTKNEKSDSILINNNSSFLKNIVLFLRNCISGNEQCYKRLAEILIKDLNVCKQKIDKEYANNVLIPLLSIEKVTYVCVHPINEKIKSNYCSYINLESNNEYIEQEEKSKQTKNANIDSAGDLNEKNKKKKLSSDNNLLYNFDYKSEKKTFLKNKFFINTKETLESENQSLKSIIPESELTEEYQNQFTKLFNSFEYQKDQKFSHMTFKKILSSKGLASEKLRTQIANNISNQGPFLIIMYPSQLEKYNKAVTFFFYNGTFPSITLSQNIDESDENIIIPYNSQNMICQISEKNYISASLKSEMGYNFKEYELGSITIEEDSIILSIMDIINLYLTNPKNSNINPYIENLKIFKKNGMEDLYYLNTISYYEIYIGKKEENVEIKTNSVLDNYSNNKIIPFKYIDEIGNLNINYVKQNKYYHEIHPFCLTRDNPIFEIPSNIQMKQLKEMLYSHLIPFKNLKDGKIIPDEQKIGEIEKFSDSNMVDIYYDIQSLKDFRTKQLNGEIQQNIDFNNNIQFNVNEYEPHLPVLLEFENLGGINQIISVLKTTIKSWKNKKVEEFWIKWIDNVDKFSQLPSFFSALIRHQKCFNILFNLLCGIYDNNSSVKDIGIEATKYILEILDNSFAENKSYKLRQISIEKGIFKNILEKLELLTHEKPRKFEPKTEQEEKEEEEKEKEKEKEKEEKKKSENNNKNKKTKGVGYGSDKTGDNKSWDVNIYLEGKKSNSSQIVVIIKLLINFFNTPNFEMNENLMKTFLESPILPCLESAYRGGTLLELSKDSELYMTYLQLTVVLSKNHSLIPLLLEISKDYKPVQIQSVYNLLSLLYDGAKIFMNCLKQNAKKEKSNEEKLATEIINSYNIVTKNIKLYQSSSEQGKNYTEILKLPVEKSYPLLLRELAFDYMNMRNINGNLVHYYSSYSSGEPTPTKAIRLAQEFADLPRALPCESTNSIYVRVDKNNMDYMKVLIIGSEGTPYSNGAFLFDVFFDNQYPNLPPKVTLMTTGGGTTRFNPNLYSNGKVCLSLLGTWRGQSTENWDPKISTLLQVLISIQSIIMSDLVYYNEPSCESEMGTSSGEAKNEAYSNIVRYANIKYAMIEQIKKPSLGFEEVIKRHFYLKKKQILKEVRGWIDRSRTATAKYSSYSLDHNQNWANKFNKPGEYTRMLEEIFYELESTLDSLPLPQELKKKAEDEKIETEKKAEKMKFENLDKVDMSYDDNKKEQKSMNLNDDKVKDRWSRYIGAMGIEAVRRQANSTILVYGAGGLGIEIAKNLVLSGCKELILQDNKITTFYDLSSQFYLKESDIGKNRAESCIKKLQDLNYYVKVSASTECLQTDEKSLANLKKFNVIVLTECDYETALIIDKYCRENKIYLIVCDIYGAAGRIINDFGDEFIVNDKDGEDAKEIMVKDIKIKDEKTAEVTVLEGLRHDFSDNDLVEVIEVLGLDGINKRQFTIKSLTKDKFEIIGDFKDIKNNYQRNGIVKQIKTQKKIKFLPLKDCLNSFTEESHSKLIEQNMAISDFTKISNGFIINLAFTSINNYLREKKSFTNTKIISNPWDYNQLKLIMDNANKIISDNKIEINENQKKLLHKIIFTYIAQFSPLCAYLGGFAAQEVIKAITNKYSPVNQIIYQDCLELIPDIDVNTKETIEKSLKDINFKENNNRLDGLQVILGKELLNKLINMKCLIVGAGAIGCELIKNFSMLNVGTGNNGSIYITDPDIIEVSNLTRQFLFREKHLRLPKSSTAAAAAIQMNPNLSGHIFAKLDKVCEETENIFTDTFFSSLDFVANALDNVNARRYVDSRCVANRKPLLESGTLGPKGHVQVIIPFKTESYGSQNDPEVSNDIPQCTLKMFPEEAIHCVEWARDQFGKKFTQLPKALNKRIEEAKNGEENNDLKLTKKAIKWLKKLPKTFDDCLKISRDKFNKVFVLNIKQLLYSYPLDKKDKNGKLFWTLPKRPPISLDYSIDDQLCADFISAYACLIANMFNIKIPYDNPRDPKSKQDMIIKTKNMSVEEFVPNELKAKQIEDEVESENKDKSEKDVKEKKEEIQNKENEEMLYNKELISLLKDEKLGYNKMKPLTSVEFEKDDDTNFQIDIMYAMSALRCRNYKLEIMDWMTVKIKAGRIIPALATTTSSIAALQAIELVKIAKNSPIEEYRNSFLNLAIPLLQSSEPGACIKNIIREGLTTTLWDRWEINLPQKECTIKNLFEILKTKYLLFPRDIFKGKKPVYSYAAYKDKKEINEELINKKIDTLLGINFSQDEYVDLMITFTKDEKSEEYIKNVPKVRLFFK